MIAASLLLLALVQAPAAGEAPPEPASIVDQVIELLEADVAPGIVERWVLKQKRPLPPLAADDLIRLTRAGAPEALIARMLELSGRPGGDQRAGRAAPPSPSPTAEAPSAALRPGPATTRKPEARPAAPAMTPPASGTACCLLDIELDYRAVEELDGEEEQPGRDLFAYLDGDYLARLSSRGDVGMNEPLRFAVLVEPGPHRLRLARQKHERRRRGEYAHEIRVSPHPLDFEVSGEPGRWKLEVAWRESLFSSASRPPLSWTLLHDGRKIAGERAAGVAKESWPWLCEVAESDAERRGCLAWTELWTSPPDSDWSTLLRTIAAERFRPPPAPYLERADP